MDLNRTMLGQMITFGIFIWFTMKFVWPVLAAAMEERKKKISEGLAAAEKGAESLKDAEQKIDEKMQEVRRQSHELLANAHKTASEIVEEAREVAEREKERIVAMGQEQVERSVSQAKESLRKELAELVIEGTTKLLSREVKPADHEKVLGDFAKKLQ